MAVSVMALRCFLTLVEELHFSRAAQKLNMKPPSLTYQIDRLEKHVGSPLFHRSSRGVTLTQTGAELLPIAQAAVAQLDAVEQFVTHHRSVHTAHLRIGTQIGGLGRHTTPVITELLRRAPALQVEFIRCEPTNFIPLIRDGQVDIGISPLLPGLSLPDDIESTRVAALPRAVVLPSSHPLAGRRTITLADIENDTYLRLGDPQFDSQGRLGAFDPRPNGHRLTWGARAADIEGLLEMCAAGMGIHLGLVLFQDRYARPGLDFIPISDAPPADLIIAARRTNTSPFTRLFIDIVTQHLRDADSIHRSSQVGS